MISGVWNIWRFCGYKVVQVGRTLWMQHPVFTWKVTNGLLASQSTFCPHVCITWLPLQHAIHPLTLLCGATGVTFNPLTPLWKSGGSLVSNVLGPNPPSPFTEFPLLIRVLFFWHIYVVKFCLEDKNLVDLL